MATHPSTSPLQALHPLVSFVFFIFFYFLFFVFWSDKLIILYTDMKVDVSTAIDWNDKIPGTIVVNYLGEVPDPEFISPYLYDVGFSSILFILCLF
jgi:hypothetical protein